MKAERWYPESTALVFVVACWLCGLVTGACVVGTVWVMAS